MGNKLEIIIQNHQVMLERMNYIWELVGKGLHRGEVVVTLGRPTRTIQQNRLLWPTLKDISDQVDWYGTKPSSEDWKHIFTASLHGQRTQMGIDGNIVVMGKSTSKMNKKEFSDLMELIFAFGAEKDVKWSKQSGDIWGEWRGN